jgi:hypothetical protein
MNRVDERDLSTSPQAQRVPQRETGQAAARLEAETRRADRAERALAQSSGRSLDLLAEVGRQRERAEAAEAASLRWQKEATGLQRRVEEVSSRLFAIETSRVWRFSTRLATLVRPFRNRRIVVTDAGRTASPE